jgi:ATP-dependent helicase HepA
LDLSRKLIVMKGTIVRHDCHLGKIVEVGKRTARILYLLDNPTEREVSLELFHKQVIKHAQLPPGTRCRTTGGECCILSKDSGVLNQPPIAYRVQYDSGLSGVESEFSLTPFAVDDMNDPLSHLVTLNPQGYPLFKSRERLVEAFHRVVREGSGFRALLSSRIDLRPHQAYVAGVILMDVRRRYMLADEVGLGKTIEAGIVIHDLLSQKPDAKILIICPGALTQQWLCEIYSKFGGQVFKLLDLHLNEADPLKGTNRLIASTNLAAQRFSDGLARIDWDMVVVDEVHHLLSSPGLYRFVERLSISVPSMLLLSAIPAQKREDEFLQLLALLEPGRYSPQNPKQHDEFRELYSLQADVGRRARILERRIQSLDDDGSATDEILEVCDRLLAMPVLNNDETLRSMVADLRSIQRSEFAVAAKEILKYAVDRYRINKRILRNRREHLIREGQIHPIERKCIPCPYRPDQLEIDATDAVEALLRGATKKGLDKDILVPFARTALQSMASPSALVQFLKRLQGSQKNSLLEFPWRTAGTGELTGYTEFDNYLHYLCISANSFLVKEETEYALMCALAWANYSGNSQRVVKLIEYVKTRSRESPPPKLIVFAGYPQVAREVAEELSLRFGEEAITVFLSDLSREEKEDNVIRFESVPDTFVMVSDETGGEGRNFQFASEIIHFDMPWYVGRIEQRIGRIDRLGREKVRDDAVSVVVYNENSAEAGLFDCYREGFEVYSKSISGLEFSLRDLECEIVERAISGGRDGLTAYIPELATSAKKERALDESQALLDLASFDRSAAERFQRVLQSDESELILESAFIDYFRMIATNKSATEVVDVSHPKGIWKFVVDNTLYGVLPLKEKKDEGLFGDLRGSFRRNIARERPQLNFFHIGNPMFDAVISSLNLHPTGRTYALDCKTDEANRWVGFEFVFRVTFDINEKRNVWGLTNQARSIFTSMPAHFFFGVNGKYEPSGDKLLQIRQSLRLHDKGVTWWNLTKESASILPGLIKNNDWQSVILSAYEEAQSRARSHFEARLGREAGAEVKRLKEMLESIRKLGGHTAEEETKTIQSLIGAIRNWRVELDAVGFLGVNLGLREIIGHGLR